MCFAELGLGRLNRWRVLTSDLQEGRLLVCRVLMRYLMGLDQQELELLEDALPCFSVQLSYPSSNVCDERTRGFPMTCPAGFWKVHPGHVHIGSYCDSGTSLNLHYPATRLCVLMARLCFLWQPWH